MQYYLKGVVMKFGVLAVILMTLSFIFYNEIKKDNYNIIIKENEENNIYNANYIVTDNDIILENTI